MKVDYCLYIIKWLLHGAIDPAHVGWGRTCIFRIQLIMRGMILPDIENRNCSQPPQLKFLSAIVVCVHIQYQGAGTMN